MKITKDTTDEQLMAPVVRALQSLQKTVNLAVEHGWPERGSEGLADAVNDVARNMGEATLYSTVRDALKGAAERDEDTKEATRKALLHVLTQATRDTWSGRANDVRRAEHDGLVEAARQISMRDF